jgi:hypothetical protein
MIEARTRVAMRKTAFAVTTALTLILCQSLYAIHRGGNDLPYAQAMTHPLDKPLNDKYGGKCFFMNLGPTGIRARIDPEAPTKFKVTYVFQDAKSPAKGKIKIGDMIIGANGKTFHTPHGFHRKRAGSRGWQGPPFDLALAIEDSQGKDGKLDLTVMTGDGKSGRDVVTLQLKPVGRFSETYPWNCPRSDKLLEELCDFMFEDGVPKGRPTTIQAILALWASGDKRAIPLVKGQAEGMMKGRRSPAETGMITWMWGYQGIFLGEYYNAFKDKGVRGAVEALNNCFELGMDYGSGGFSHRPFPYIQQRAADTGVKGYGSMAGPGGLSMLAQSIFQQTGLPISERAYNRTHQAYLGGAGHNSSGSSAYGFGGRGWSSVNIRLKHEATSLCSNKEGIGYICPTGMKYIGDFEVEKWTQISRGKWDMKMVPPTGEFSWLKSDADKLLVYKTGGYMKGKTNQRMVIRPTFHPEPTAPYANNHAGGGHNAPVGMGALAHFIGNTGNTSWNHLGKHMATCCAYSPGRTWDGHACGEMHAFFNILGASRADEKDFRHFLDYYKTLIILSETHDERSKGGLVEQPFGCQRNATCSIQRNRKIYTYNTILLLSIPKRKLLITGADCAQPAAATTDPFFHRAPKPVARQPRTLSSENQAELDRALLKALVTLSDDGSLEPIPLRISKSQSTIWLSKAMRDGTLTFQILAGTRTAEFELQALSPGDHATLAVLMATLKPSSSDVAAMAGVYMERVGRVDDADTYFESAGATSRAKLEKLFD